MVTKESNRKKWNTQKIPIVENLKGAIVNREETLEHITESQKNLGKARDIINEELSRLRPIRQIYENKEAFLSVNPVIHGSIDTMTKFSEYDLEYSKRLASQSSHLRGNTDLFLGTLNISGSMTASNMGTVTTYLASRMEDNEGIISYVEQIKDPSAIDRRTELLSKLDGIDPRLSIKLIGAWETLQDDSKQDRFLQAASSARELISDLLCFLAPDREIKKISWFIPERENGLPTQKQRARYAMLGKNESLGDEQLTTIYEIMDNIRNSYTELNPIAHLRYYTSDLQNQIESLIDQCQIYLLKLLENRQLYFVQ